MTKKKRVKMDGVNFSFDTLEDKMYPFQNALRHLVADTSCYDPAALFMSANIMLKAVVEMYITLLPNSSIEDIFKEVVSSLPELREGMEKEFVELFGDNLDETVH